MGWVWKNVALVVLGYQKFYEKGYSRLEDLDSTPPKKSPEGVWQATGLYLIVICNKVWTWRMSFSKQHPQTPWRRLKIFLDLFVGTLLKFWR